MSLFREIPPTAGLPIYFRDLFSAFFKKNGRISLEEDFKRYIGAQYAEVTYSGTAAFYIILQALKKISAKKSVIIPSFICPLIPLAIKRAGLKTLVCDISKESFNFDFSRLEELCLKNNDILAVVPVHLAGIPVDLEPIQNLAKKNSFFVIEDCAQGLGAIYHNKKVGSIGDFAFFSLCRGKGLTIYEGGLIISREEFAQVLNETLKQFQTKSIFSETLKCLELFGYWIFYRPFLFWLVFRLPQIFWEIQGKKEKAFIEYFTIDFPLHKVSSFRKRVGHAIFSQLDTEIKKQRNRADYFIKKLRQVPGISLIAETEGDYSNYPYLTLIFKESQMRNRIFEIFKSSGLGVSRIYLSAVSDYKYLKDIFQDVDCPNARYIADRHITLTTSTFLKENEADKLIEGIKNLK